MSEILSPPQDKPPRNIDVNKEPADDEALTTDTSQCTRNVV